MPERWVVNASPLIALGSIGRLDPLTSFAEDVVVPEIVAEELLRVADEAALAFSRASPTRIRPALKLPIAVAFMAGAVSADPIPAPQILPTPAPHIQFGGGDGSDCAHAVVITGAGHETEGVRAERWWVYSKNPDSRIASQSVSEKDGRVLETIQLLAPDGRSRSICFDITTFFGKP